MSVSQIFKKMRSLISRMIGIGLVAETDSKKMIRSISEIIAEANSKSKKEDQIAVLRYYNHEPLKYILRMTFDPNVEWVTSPDIEYKKNPYLDQEGALLTQYKKLYLFIKGGNDNLTQLKRDLLFIQVLESIHANDAELVLMMRNKSFAPKYKKITKELVDETWPGLI